MAVGAREYVLAVVGTALVLFSLGPLSRIAARLHPEGQRQVRLRVELGRLDALGELSERIVATGTAMAGIETHKLGKGRYAIDLDLRVPARMSAQAVLTAISAVAEVEVVQSSEGQE